MATTRSKKAPYTQPKPRTIDIEVNVEEFTAGDYEILLDWTTGNSQGHSVGEVFDILDRLVVGGFRQRKLIDLKGVIKTILEKVMEYTDSKN